MKHFNKIIVCGLLQSYDDVNRPPVRFMEGSGDAVCNFNVVETQYDYKTGKPREYEGKVSKKWHRCTAWREQAEVAGRLDCGMLVLVVGKVVTRYDEKNKVYRDEVTVSVVMPAEERTATISQDIDVTADDPVKFPDVNEIINLDTEEDYI